MNRRSLILSLALLVIGLTASQARAQRRDNYNPFVDRPTTSPYLNLFQEGGDPGYNYHRLVRPEMDFRSFNTRQRRALSEVDRRITDTQGVFDSTEDDDAVALGGLGHPTYYMNYRGHYQLGSARGSRTNSRASRPKRSRSIISAPRGPGSRLRSGGR